MTKTHDFYIFRGSTEWHVSDSKGKLVGEAGDKTLKDAILLLHDHLNGQSFEVVRRNPGDYDVFLQRSACLSVK